MKKFISSFAVMALAFASPAMAVKTEAYKTNKNMQGCENKCKVLFGNSLVRSLFTNTPEASEVTCVEFCMQNPSIQTSQLPVDKMKYHVLDTYLWGKSRGNPQVFQIEWNAFKAWMDGTYLKQCSGLQVINRNFVSKVKKSYKNKKGKIFCFGDRLQTYNKTTATVGILK